MIEKCFSYDLMNIEEIQVLLDNLRFSSVEETLSKFQ
jgi:hypothetical protein